MMERKQQSNESNQEKNSPATAKPGWFRDLFRAGKNNKLEEEEEEEDQQQQQQLPPTSQYGRKFGQSHSSRDVTAEIGDITTDIGDAKYRRSNSMEAMVPRHPSVPSIINGIRINDDGDDLSIAQSAVSEVTLMTYSDEKVELLKKELVSRIRKCPKRLSIEERGELLREVQAEQQELIGDDANGFFEKLHALRLQNLQAQEESQRLILLELEKKQQSLDNGRGNAALLGGDAAGGGGGEQPRWRDRCSLAQSFTSTVTNKCNNESRRHLMMEGLKNEESGPSAIFTHAMSKYCNPIRRQSEVMNTVVHVESDQRVAPEPVPEHQQPYTETEITNTKNNNSMIDDIIELKLLVANQQATIDTLSSQNHNLELANRQLSRVEQSKSQHLAAENSHLTEQLKDCREREICLRKEMMEMQHARGEQEVTNHCNLPEQENQQQEHHELQPQQANNTVDTLLRLCRIRVINRDDEIQATELSLELETMTGLNRNLSKENSSLQRELECLRRSTTTTSSIPRDGRLQGKDKIRLATSQNSQATTMTGRSMLSSKSMPKPKPTTISKKKIYKKRNGKGNGLKNSAALDGSRRSSITTETTHASTTSGSVAHSL